jgi:hypothetical protein
MSSNQLEASKISEFGGTDHRLQMSDVNILDQTVHLFLIKEGQRLFVQNSKGGFSRDHGRSCLISTLFILDGGLHDRSHHGQIALLQLTLLSGFKVLVIGGKGLSSLHHKERLSGQVTLNKSLGGLSLGLEGFHGCQELELSLGSGLLLLSLSEFLWGGGGIFRLSIFRLGRWSLLSSLFLLVFEGESLEHLFTIVFLVLVAVTLLSMSLTLILVGATDHEA